VVTVPPLPLRQVVPASRGAGAPAVFQLTKIAVLVSVDKSGRVTSARADESSKKTNLFLIGQSISAAREWTFRPASRAGVAIPSEYRIEFVFRPETEASRPAR